MQNNTSGSNNIAIGYDAGVSITSEIYNLLIGSKGTAGDLYTIRIGDPVVHARNFQAGIRDVSALNTDTTLVSIDSNGQLGTGIIFNNINLANTTSTSGALLKTEHCGCIIMETATLSWGLLLEI